MQSLTLADVYVTAARPAQPPWPRSARAWNSSPSPIPAASSPARTPSSWCCSTASRWGQAITLHAGDDRYAEAKTPPVTLVSDDQGRFTVKVARSGVYQIQARYRVAPTATDATGHSYTYALTFESLR
jgi:hypothetical protein